MIYSEETLAVVLSFLQDAPPYYALEDFPEDEEMWNSFQKTHYLVLLVLTRLATYKESEVSTLCSEQLNLGASGAVFIQVESVQDVLICEWDVL
jgi:hypothetical protein